MGDLCKLGVGCIAGALCYADDLVLLAPPSALRIMLNCCENFAIIRGLKFNDAVDAFLLLPFFLMLCQLLFLWSATSFS